MKIIEQTRKPVAGW